MAHNIKDMVYENTRANAQALADVQDEQIERERRRRVAEANRSAFDAARDAERGSRGGAVSSMNQWGPDGSVASSFSNTVFGPQTGGMPIRVGWDAIDTQARIGSEFADLARRSAAVKQHNARIGADSMNAAMRAAMANGGRLPQNAVDMLSRNLGLDGRNSAVYSAGYLNNGDFDIDIVTRGANGGLQRTTKKITPLEQYNMMLAAPGVWGEDGVVASQGLYNRLRNTRGKSELQSPSVYADNLRAYNTQKQSAHTLKMMTGLYQAVYKDMSKGGKQPVTTDVIRARMASDLLKDKNIGPQITSVPDLNEDGTQKMVEDENGQQVPAMRQADPNNPDDVERVKQNLKMRLDLVPELAPRQDAQGGGEADRRLAFLKYIYDRENPQTPQDVLAFQQRQRERQMREAEEAQARDDITRRPQQVINYFKDGRWYSGNGYVRDGKVYDGQGYEIEGATPAEMARGEDGGVVSNEKGWFARALPPATELMGGQAGAAGQGGGAESVSAGKDEGVASDDATTSDGAAQPESERAQKALELAKAEKERRLKASADVAKSGGTNKPAQAEDKLPQEEKELVKREREFVEQMKSLGGVVEKDDDGNIVSRIADFEYLPKDVREKYPNGIVREYLPEKFYVVPGIGRVVDNSNSGMTGVTFDEVLKLQKQAVENKKKDAARKNAYVQKVRSDAENEARRLFASFEKRKKHVADKVENATKEYEEWKRLQDVPSLGEKALAVSSGVGLPTALFNVGRAGKDFMRMRELDKKIMGK